MRAFWAKGYEATSLGDLVAATGLHKGSLYQAFGDKHALYLRTLNRYLANIRQHKNELLDGAATPLEGVRTVLHHFIDMANGDANCPQGCMALRSTVELASHDADVERIMDEHKRIMHGTIQEKIAEAQASGEISGDKSPEMISSLIMVFMSGLAALSGGGTPVEEAHALLDAQLDQLL